ncbi:MAG: RepB family plasmid replication initiator protein [Cetobacterium sp.]
MNIVKYHNSFNKLKIGNLTENETDIFFSLLMKARDKEDNIVKLDFLDLKKLADLDRNNSATCFIVKSYDIQVA